MAHLELVPKAPHSARPRQGRAPCHSSPLIAECQSSHRLSRARRIDCYVDERGQRRELIARFGFAGSVLVTDRNLQRGDDERLLAHLSADEPHENAELVCRCYLEDEIRARRCRQVCEDDGLAPPFSGGSRDPRCLTGDVGFDAVESRVAIYRLKLVPSRTTIPQLRWNRSSRGEACEKDGTISLREAIAGSESYSPFCAITQAALARHSDDPAVSITVLRAELERVLESPIVLNRGLREAVLVKVEVDELSLSEIAIRCGRTKRDCKGNLSGETSWLARRLGLLAEGGHASPTPWVHSDVLALIARRGIGVSPREVELG